MGRVRANIRVRRRDRWTLFDTGARSTYILTRAARGPHARPLSEPILSDAPDSGAGARAASVPE